MRRLILTSTSQMLTVSTDRQGKNIGSMTVEHTDGLSVRNLPKAQGTIITAARQQVTLGAKRKAPNPIGRY